MCLGRGSISTYGAVHLPYRFGPSRASPKAFRVRALQGLLGGSAQPGRGYLGMDKFFRSFSFLTLLTFFLRCLGSTTPPALRERDVLDFFARVFPLEWMDGWMDGWEEA